MKSSTLENPSEKLSELNYLQRHALFFGGEQPAYAFKSLDDKTTHECGKGLAGLYRAILWLQRDDIPQADEMHAMLETHKSNPDDIMAYVKKQTEEALPEGSTIRADILAIVNNGEKPAKQVDQFMAYMDMLMPVVGNSSNLVDMEHALTKIRTVADQFITNPTIKGMNAFFRAKSSMQAAGVEIFNSFASWVEFVDKCAPLGGLAKYHISAGLAAELSEDGTQEIGYEQLHAWMVESFSKRVFRDAKRLAVSIIKRFPDKITGDEVSRLCGNISSVSLDWMCEIQVAAIESGMQGITIEDIEAWLNAYVPDKTQGKPGRWDLYQKLALAVVNKREVDKNGVLVKQAIPGISDSQILEWALTLDRARESVLAAELYLAEYNKGVEGTNIDGAQAIVEAALRQGGGGFVQIGYGAGTETRGTPTPDLAIELAGALIEAHGDLFSPDMIFRWNDYTTPKVASSTNGERVLVAALRNTDLRKKINIVRLATIVQGCIDLADARKTDAFYVQAARIAAAAVESGVANVDYARIWVNKLKHFGALHMAIPLLVVMVKDQQKFGVSPSLVQQWLDTMVYEREFTKAQEFAQEVLSLGVPLERAKVLGLAEKLAASNPVKAVELCLAAQDAGMDVPEEVIQQYHSACYDGKTPEEAANNAMTLVEVYRNRLAFRRMNASERAALEQEIRQGFAKVLSASQGRRLAEMPFLDGMRFIHEVLFSNPAAGF